MLEVLRRRDFGLLWSSGLVSLVGDWILYAALPYFVFSRTGSTLATAGMIVAELLPGFLLESVAGVFVDRWDRKRVLVWTNLVQAVVVLPLLLVAWAPTDGPGHGFPLWLVYAVAAAQSCVAAFSAPAEGALLPAIVASEQLLTANALSALANRLARLVGVPIGGVLLGAAGLAPVVVADSATFVIALLLVVPIASPGPPAREPEPGRDPAASAVRLLLHEWLDGFRLVGRERSLATLFIVLGLMTFGGTMLDPLDVAWVRQVLGVGPAAYSALLTAHAATGIVGALLVAWLGSRVPVRYLVGVTSVVAGFSLALQYNLPALALALALTSVRGFTSAASTVGVQTLVQQQVPDAYRGRVLGSLGASGALLSLLGAGVGGGAAQAVGIVPMLDVAAGLIVLAGVVVMLVYRPRP